MRYIQRGIAPKKLDDPIKVKDWTDQYLKRREQWKKNGSKGSAPRPHHNIYAEEGVCEKLVSMSGGGKCFYCESKLNIDYDEDGTPIVKEYEIDHHVELAEKPELAYTWENLYLACQHCNDKHTNKDIPNSEVLDPCSNRYPHAKHISFEQEVILSLTKRGSKTIEKYKLYALETRRLKQLQKLYTTLFSIQKQQIADGGRPMNTDEIKVLRKFAAKEYPFSLMFSVILAQHNL